MDCVGATCINSIPPEVLKHVFDLLSIDNKRIVRLTCQKWRYILDEFGWPESVSFRPKLRGTRRNEVIQRFLKSYRVMKDVLAESCNFRMSKTLNNKERRFPIIQGNVILGRHNSQSTTVNFLKYGCTYANSLDIQSNCFLKTRRYVISGLLKQSIVEFSHLTKLRVDATFDFYLNEQNYSHLKACSTFLKHARIPNLREFKFSFDHYRHAGRHPWLLYKRTIKHFVELLAKHAGTLKVLSYRISLEQRELPFDWSLISENLNLECCTIIVPDDQARLRQLMLPKLTTSCGLKSIKIENLEFRHDGVISANATIIREVLLANSTSLEEVHLTCCQFDVNWLRPCTKLKQLELNVWCFNETQRNTNDPYNFPSLAHVDLELCSETHQNPLTFGYETLLTSVGTSIRHLKIQLFSDIVNEDGTPLEPELDVNGWGWLNACVNLEYLCLPYQAIELTTNIAAVFPRLKYFDGCRGHFFGHFEEEIIQEIIDFANWIALSMPNLKTIKVNSYITLPALKIYLQMHGCQEVHFTCFGFHADAIIQLFENYCNSPEQMTTLKFERTNKFFYDDEYKISRVRIH